MVTGAPGTRRQYANDFTISDWVLARGYAFASTDKGNDGATVYDDGSSPGGSIREWNRRVTQLTRAARAVVAQRYGHAPRRTYMFGVSNGGYLTRWQLENHPGLYDGGLDWEGTLFRAQGPNLSTYLPTALASYPSYQATGDRAAHDAMIRAGFAPGSEFLWPYHYSYYWDLTQRVYREELDPTYDGALKAGTPFCQAGTGVPGLRRGLRLREAAGRRHRYYRIVDGTHVDGLYDTYPDLLRPLLPCARTAFGDLTAWVERGVKPPRDATYPRPSSGDLRNSCRL